MNEYNYSKALEKLKRVRQEYKKKRSILNENEANFGFKNMELLLEVKNDTEVKGYPYKVIKKDGEMYGIKVIPVTKDYPKNENPTYLEGILLKEFTEEILNKNISPHLVYYITSKKIANSSKAIRHINLKKMENEERIDRKSVVLMSEFVNGGNLSDWVYNTYEEHKSKNNFDKTDAITNIQWKCIVFGILYTIHVLQDKYKFMHNDFHYGNILMDTSIKASGYHIYKIKNHGIWYIPNTGVIPKIWDMEFGMSFSNQIKGIYPNRFVIADARYDNKKNYTIEEDLSTEDIINVPVNYNKVYDVHYFLTGLLDLYISQELFEWIVSLYPAELIPDEEVDITDTQGDITTSTNTDNSHKDMTNSSNNEENSYETSLETDTYTSILDESVMTFLHDSRMINGVEKMFNDLPEALNLLKSDFFDVFKQKPKDLDISKCEIFEF